MEFIASVEQVHNILEWIGKQLESMRLDPRVLHHLELASEEALVNIIRHGYEDRPEKIEIRIEFFEGRAEIVFEDHGPAFNPLKAKEVDLNVPLEERKIGGLGIHLMRKCIDEIHYERRDAKNILTFVIIHSSQKK